MDYRKIYESWVNDPYFDEETRAELRSIADDDHEIRERFYTDLEFGTAGMRGLIGNGTNRINRYIVRKATQGLANYIIEQKGENRGVAIAFDSRHFSPEFAEEAALTLAGNGIKAFLFESLRPTPELSFAVRKLHCIAGINITASHNPSAYNGYKVYWEDGAQITDPHASAIVAHVKAVTDWNTVKTMSAEEAKEKELLTVIGAEVDDAYMEALKKQAFHPDLIRERGGEVGIVYSPLHGTGLVPSTRILSELGFTRVFVVPEQAEPDGDFPSVPYPNPEADQVFELGLSYAKEQDADIVLATDPDADRLGVRVRDKEGNYHTLTGNMSGTLLADYVISQTKERDGKLPEDGILIKTIVTTNMVDALARDYGIGLLETLTGFKFIGQQILRMEETGKGTYLFGFEESYGCLPGTYARDKDAIVAVLLLCEAALYYKTKGLTLWDAMLSLYERYGYFLDSQKSVEMSGVEGAEQIRALMASLREHPLSEIAGEKVVEFRDYRKDEITDLLTGEVRPTGLPNSDVLYYELEDGSWICVRPSGTEPKVKFYYGVKGSSFANADEKGKVMEDALSKLAEI